MQAKLPDLLQQTSLGRRNNGLSVSHKTLSTRQHSDIATFKRLFPTEQQVIAYFSPANWPAILNHREKSLLCPYVTLRVLEEYYITGTAKSIVCNNLIGVLSISRPTENFNRDAIEQAAELFVGKLGTDITPYGVLDYFANYLMEYKNSYVQFDLQDLLRQCTKVFLPRWQKRLVPEQNTTENLSSKEVGTPALYRYLRREYTAKGRDIRESAVYKSGIINDNELEFIESGEEIPF